jgi:hypothetical protein
LILATFAIAFALPCPRTESRPQTVNPPPQNAETQAAAAQEASLKVEAPSVIADVIVTDKKGRHASGLAADDFRVYEDDAPQKIVTFVPPVIEAGTGPADPSDPLRGPNYQLYVPAQPRFSASDKLTVYFGLLDVPLNPTTRRPELRLSFALKSGAKAALTLPSEQIVALPKASEDRLLVLKQFDLRELRPGPYTFEVTVEDQVTGGVVSQMANFLVE